MGRGAFSSHWQMSKPLIRSRTAGKRHAHYPQHCNEATSHISWPSRWEQDQETAGKAWTERAVSVSATSHTGGTGVGGHTRAGEDSSYLDTNCDRLPPLSSLTAMPHPLHRAAVGLAEHGCLEALQPVTAMVLLFLLRRARHQCGTALSLCPLRCDCSGHLEFLGAQVGHVPAPPRLWGDYGEQIPCLPQGLLFCVYSGAGGN